MTTLTIRIDEETKSEASAVAKAYGLDLSSITRAFLTQVARERRIPLDVGTPLPNDETLQSITDAQAIIERGGKGYETADDVLAAARASA